MRYDDVSEKVRNDQREEIRGYLADLGWKSTQLARAARVSPSTLNKFMVDAVHHALSATTMEKVRAVVAKQRNIRPALSFKTLNRIATQNEPPVRKLQNAYTTFIAGHWYLIEVFDDFTARHMRLPFGGDDD